MIFQEPMTALDPVFTIGSQLREAIVTHRPELSRAAADELAVGDARARRHPRRAPPARQLSARVLGRHAPARDDRDGAGDGARPPHRRRADHRARRHHPGADPRADARSPRDRPGSPRCCSSPTTSRWWRRPATASPSCTAARSRRSPRPGRSSASRSIPTPRACSRRCRAPIDRAASDSTPSRARCRRSSSCRAAASS